MKISAVFKSKRAKTAVIDSFLLSLSLTTYFLYAYFDMLVYGIIFTVSGCVQIGLRVWLENQKASKINFKKWLPKDFVTIILLSLIFAVIIAATNSFSMNYSTYFIFNLAFIGYILFLICFDALERGPSQKADHSQKE